MEQQPALSLTGFEGLPVNLVLYGSGPAQLFATTFVAIDPVRLLCANPGIGSAHPGQRVLLLADRDRRGMRTEGVLEQIVETAEGVEFLVGNTNWESLERRRHIRVPVSLPVTIRELSDGASDPVEGTTVDISLSGAFIQAPELLSEGALVEVCLDLDGAEIKTLAVVARLNIEQGGMGLHFVEYLERTTPLLADYLSGAA